ncbi:MAG: hypothetical protein WDN67_04920 [Candidatus Moraniibacteriota bacterium]
MKPQIVVDASVWTFNETAFGFDGPIDLNSSISDSHWSNIEIGNYPNRNLSGNYPGASPTGHSINDQGVIVGTAVYTPQDPSDPTPTGLHGIMLIPMQLISDVNGDGKFDDKDTSLMAKALSPSATDDSDEKKDGTEYLFHDDHISHGVWSNSDPQAPPGTSIDDNAKQLLISCGINFGNLWFEHPAITNLSFYPTRACTAGTQISFPITPSALMSLLSPYGGVNGNQMTLYVRVEGNLPTTNPDGTGPVDTSQTYGNLDFPQLPQRPAVAMMQECPETEKLHRFQHYQHCDEIVAPEFHAARFSQKSS